MLAKTQEEESLTFYIQLMMKSTSNRAHVHVAIVPVCGDYHYIRVTSSTQQHLLGSHVNPAESAVL
jgi:hypothetical protein